MTVFLLLLRLFVVAGILAVRIKCDAVDAYASEGSSRKTTDEENDEENSSPPSDSRQQPWTVRQRTQSIHELQCHATNDGQYKCEFLVTPNEKAANDNKEESSAMYCDSDKNFCINVEVSSTMTDETRIAAARHSAASTPSSTTFRSITQPYYTEPYAQYGAHVGSVLEHWRMSDDKAENEGEENYMTAEWMHQLGVAHRNQADEIHLRMEAAEHNGETDTVAADEHDRVMFQQELDWSARAFRLALQYYEGLEQPPEDEGSGSIEDDPWFSVLKHIHNGIAHYNLADIMSLSLDPEQSAFSKDYFIHSENNFAKHRHVLMEAPPTFDQMRTKFPYWYKDEDKSMESLWREARLYWAQSCSRLGVLELSSPQTGSNADTPGGQHHVMIQNGGMMDLQNMAADVLSAGQMTQEEQIQTIQDLVSAELPKVLERTTRAEAHFTQAVAVFRKVLSDSPGEDIYTLRHLGNALQNLGVADLSKGETVRGIRHMEEALESLDRTSRSFSTSASLGISSPISQMEYDDAVHAIGEILYGLSDAYLQLGNYEKSHERYDRAMQFYRENRIAPIEEPPVAMDEVFEQSIREYEKALEEYQEIFAGGGDASTAGIDESGQHYQQDQGYEADIHSGLGALYISAADYTEALVHISQAVQLYKQNGEAGEKHYGDLLINQSILFFKMGEYEQSGEVRYEALEIYRKHSGDGVNPLLDGIDMSSFQTLMDEAQRGVGSSASDSTSGGTTIQATKSLQEQEVSHTGGATDETKVQPLQISEEASNETEIHEIMPIVGVH